MPHTSMNALFYLSLFSFSISIVSSRLTISPKENISFTKKTSSMLRRSSSSLFDMPDASIAYLASHSGYYNISDVDGERMFYYFFDQRATEENSPVAIWLTGVPGLTSGISLFHENGPFYIDEDAEQLSLTWNELGWDTELNMIFVDEPIGTGFSSTSLFRRSQTLIVNDLYNFLKIFFTRNPRYRNRDFFILGQSYAGKYGFELAALIYKKYLEGLEIHIKLMGVAIGNGFTNPKKQFESIPHFLRSNGLIFPENEENVKTISDTCQTSTTDCESSQDEALCIKAYNDCGKLLQAIPERELNIYNVMIPNYGSLHYDFSDVHKFFNTQNVKTALNVRGLKLLDKDVYDALKGEYMKSGENDVIFLLENGINVLIYAGERDLICNWEGNLNWLEELNWNGRDEFANTHPHSFLVDGEDVGSVKWHKNLFFVTIHGAGHMVAMDKRVEALNMIKMWKSYVYEYV